MLSYDTIESAIPPDYLSHARATATSSRRPLRVRRAQIIPQRGCHAEENRTAVSETSTHFRRVRFSNWLPRRKYAYFEQASPSVRGGRRVPVTPFWYSKFQAGLGKLPLTQFPGRGRFARQLFLVRLFLVLFLLPSHLFVVNGFTAAIVMLLR